MEENIIVDKNKLEQYDEKVSKVKFVESFKGLSKDQNDTVKHLVSFLKDYFEKEKYQKKTIDAQNLYFSKKQASVIAEIFKNSISISDKTIFNYVSTALKNAGLKDFFFSKSDVISIENKLTKEFEKVLSEFDDEEKDDLKKENGKEKTESFTQKEILNYINKNIYSSKINLSKTIMGFLNKNVFSNLFASIGYKKIKFVGTTKLSRSVLKSRSAFFSKLWNPSIAEIKRPFRRFEINFSIGFKYRARRIVKKYAKGTTNFLNLFFPLTLISGVLKVGFTLVKIGFSVISTSIKFIYNLVSKALSFVVSSVKFVIRSAVRIGSGTIKLLSKAINKITSSKIIKISGKLLLGFFRTHVGAYFLGYLVGTIVRKFSGILDLLKSIKDGAISTFNIVSNYVKDNIVPYLAPIINFYKNEFFASFNDEKEGGLISQLDSIIENLKPTAPDFNPEVINAKLLRFENWINKVFLMANNLAVEGFASVGSGMLGSIVGSHLGAALGTMIFPGIGTVAGGIIGSILGGMGGEWLGKQIVRMIKGNAAYEKVESNESPLQKYLRQSVGAESIRSAEYFENVSVAPHIGLLRKLGLRAFEEVDIENAPEINELKLHGIDLSTTYESYKSKHDITGFHELLSKFQYIDNLNYYFVLDEVNGTIDRISNLLNSNDKGIVLKEDLTDADYTTSLVLGPLKLKFKDGGRNFNPLWLKIVRGYQLNELVNKLRLNQITPENFIVAYEKLNDINTYSEIGKFKIKTKNSQLIDGANLIFRKFSLEEMKGINAIKEEKLAGMRMQASNSGITGLEASSALTNPDALNANPNLALQIQAWARERESVNEEVRKKWISIYHEPYDRWLPLDYAPQKGGNWIRHVLPYMFIDFHTSKIATQFGEDEFKYSKADDKQYGEGAISNVLQQLKSQGYDTSLINSKDIEYKLEQAMGQLSEAKLSDEQAKEFIRLISLRILNEEAAKIHPGIEILEAQIGSRLNIPKNQIEEYSHMTEAQLREAFKSSDESHTEISALIKNYKEIASDDSVFLKERILPFIQNLIEHGVDTRTIYGVFGIPYEEGILQPSPMIDIAGEPVSPSMP